MLYLVAPTKEFNEFDYNKYSLDYTDQWFLFDDYSEAAEYASSTLMDADNNEITKFVIVPLDTDKQVDVSLVYSVAFNGYIEGY